MTDDQQKEQLNKAYVHAVASVAHFQVLRPDVDRQSVDVYFSSAGEHETQPETMVGAQLKATTQDCLKEDGVHFPLKIKNYNDLRQEGIYFPRILIVMLLPEKVEDWINLSKDELLLRHCCYWTSLAGMEDTDNESTVTVTLPHENIFTPEELIQIMQNVSNNNLPL